MVRFKKYWKLTAFAAVAAAMLLAAGCSSQETAGSDAASEEAESEAAEESTVTGREANDMEKDAIRISLLEPEKPENLGTVNSLVYKGLEFDAPNVEEVTEEDVDDYFNTYVIPYLTVEASDGTVQSGDIVNIDFTGYIDGELFDGGSGESYDLEIGSGSFIDGFEDGLIGAQEGETVSLELTFPEDYWSEDLAGKPVVFETVVNSITRPASSLEDYDDEAARELMGDDTATVESSRQAIREYLERIASIDAKNTLYSNALAAAVAASDVEPSDETKEWEADLTVKSYDATLQLQGVSLAYYLYLLGTNYEEFREELIAGIDNAACEAVVRYAICEAEGLEYNDDTTEKYLDAIGYTAEEFDAAAEGTDQEVAVMWYLAAQAVVDNGTVHYVDAEELEAAAEAEAAAESETEAEAGAAD